MAQREREDIRNALCQKGFREDNNDHYYYTLIYNNQVTSIFTKISKGSKYKTIQSGLLSLMSKQMKLSNKEFLDFIDCDLTDINYIKLLKERKILR